MEFASHILRLCQRKLRARRAADQRSFQPSADNAHHQRAVAFRRSLPRFVRRVVVPVHEIAFGNHPHILQSLMIAPVEPGVQHSHQHPFAGKAGNVGRVDPDRTVLPVGQAVQGGNAGVVSGSGRSGGDHRPLLHSVPFLNPSCPHRPGRIHKGESLHQLVGGGVGIDHHGVQPAGGLADFPPQVRNGRDVIRVHRKVRRGDQPFRRKDLCPAAQCPFGQVGRSRPVERIGRRNDPLRRPLVAEPDPIVAVSFLPLSGGRNEKKKKKCEQNPGGKGAESE